MLLRKPRPTSGFELAALGTARRPARRPAQPAAERAVYLESTWKRHSAYRLLLERPPQGYRFAAADGRQEAIIGAASRFRAVYSMLHTLDRLAPVHLLKSCWDMARPRPKGARLTYAVNHLVLRREPWLLDLPCEHVSNTIGGYRHFRLFRGFVRSTLLSPHCRRIIVSIAVGKRALAAALGEDVAAKASVVHWAGEPKPFVKEYRPGGRVKMLFVDSANIPGQFRYKGGLEALEAFAALRDLYPGLELVIRSGLPRRIRERYAGMPGLRLIGGVVPWEELEREFMTADIFLLPARFTPLTVFMDAMSYELPVVTTDSWGNPEIVENGVTGLLAHDSRLARHYREMLPRYFLPPPGSRLHRDMFGEVDRDLVATLVEALKPLIDAPQLRRQMGLAGRQAVETGRFSIERRNHLLRQVLDAAIDGDGAKCELK